MFGIFDIPGLGKVVDRISHATVSAIFSGLRYTFRYKALVDDLSSEIQKLKSEKERLSVKVNEERDNGKIIYNDVLAWQKEVDDEIQKNSKKILPSWKCIKYLPIPNPISRFQLGKEAVLKAKTVTGLTIKGKELLAKEIAHLPPVENVPNADSAFWNFDSRNDAYEKLWQDLVNEDSPMIVGIYGMPGVGKSRMMQQIWKEALEKGIFNKVTLAVVGSKELDVINLQKQIASHLGCGLVSEDNKRHRANQIKNSLKNGGKILIILDDIWKVIPLEDIIGTCLGDVKIWKGYKILLTAREKSVCLNNNCKHPVEITSLTVPEAWDLFRNTVGMSKIESLNDKKLAEEVCKKCAGLPLVIHAVAKALKSMTHNLWKDTLYKLNNHNIESVGGIIGEVYACLKLSFDNLEEDAKQCLLLCCLFPKDADIPMRRLIQFATGSQLVHGGRIRILAMIDILKSSSLLIQGKDDEHFKLRDIIRDVATSVAVKDYAFLWARCGSCLPDAAADYSSRKLLHLDVEKTNFHLPDDLVCPDLHTLSLQGQYKIYIPKFSGGMFVNLRFLVLVGFFSQRQFSLQFLVKLKTLFLDDCDLRNTNAGFYPRKLETLCIWDCNLPPRLKLPNLNYLRKLEIRGRHKLQMVSNTISRLARLEELYLEYPSENWNDSARNSMPKFKEISKLTCLTSLKIFWDYFEPSEDTTIFSSLLQFDIRVGGRGKNKYRPASQVSLTRLIELTDGNNFEGFHGLVGRAEEVILQNTNVDVSKIWNSNREAFEDLRNLYIEHCNTMEHLARISQYEIQFIPRQQSSFSKLTILQITNCSAMKYLLSNSVAKCLVQLQHLSIFGCELMEVIVMNEGTSDLGDIISFSNLISLKLSDMQRLTSFYGKKRDAHSSLISDIDNSTNSTIHSSQSQPLFDGMVVFPSLEELELRGLKEISNIWGKRHCTDNVSTFFQLKGLEVSSCDKLEIVIPVFMLHRIRYLEYLKVEDCNSLRDVFLPSIARGLVHLKKLEVMYCMRMTEIIGAGQNEEFTDDIIIFPELTKLKLKFLPKLKIFWLYRAGEADIYQVQFPNLVDLTLHNVEFDFEVIELGGYDSICSLKYLDISCENEIQLPCSWQLHLDNLENLALRHCWSDELNSLGFHKVKVLKILESGCSTLFTLSVLQNLQQLQELEISNCGLLEEIVEDGRGDAAYGMNKKPITLFKLRAIILRDLPNLKRFFSSANYEFYMPALEHVEVDNCGLFTTLFTCPVSKNLQQLQFLHVYNCRLLEGIVEDARGTETCDTDDKIINLSGLLEVVLADLPNLKSFGLSVSHVFSMPELLYFRLFRCPHVENFTSLKTRGLVSVDSEWHRRKTVLHLNDFARQYRRRCDTAEDQPLRAAFLLFPWSCPWAY